MTEEDEAAVAQYGRLKKVPDRVRTRRWNVRVPQRTCRRKR